MEGLNVIVVSYRTPHDLNHFVQSLRKNAPTVPWNLTVVNVDPTEEDDDVVQSYIKKMSMHYIVTGENVGYARAVNKAAKYGTNDVLAIFNADTRITPDVLDQCYDALVNNDKWAVLGPRQIDDRGRITHGGIFGTLERRIDRGFHHRNNEELYRDVREDAVSVSGAAYFIKRRVWDELTTCPIFQVHDPSEGAFLPTPHYYEETFCSYHAIAHGYQCVYYGPAVMVHQWHRSSPVGGRADRLISTSRRIFRDACDVHNIPHE